MTNMDDERVKVERAALRMFPMSDKVIVERATRGWTVKVTERCDPYEDDSVEYSVKVFGDDVIFAQVITAEAVACEPSEGPSRRVGFQGVHTGGSQNGVSVTDISAALGDEPERAFALEAHAVRHVITAWVTRALMAEARLRELDVRLEPKRNPVWDGECWHEFSDDPDRNPDEAHARFVSADRALRWAVRTLEKSYPSPLWSPIWPEGTDPGVVLPDAAEDAAIEPCLTCGVAVGEHSNEERASCEDIAADGLGLVGDAPEPGVECKTLVDCGAVSGSVGGEVLVLHDMHPSNVTLLPMCKALVVERGGALVHLAQVAREYGVTVMLVPDASSRFQDGTWLDIDPVAGTVTAESW